MLAMVLVAIGDDRFRFAELGQHHDDLAALDLLDFARKQLPDLARELFPDARALALTDALNDALLGRLHRGAPKLVEGHFLLEDVARLEFRVLEARSFQGDLCLGILDGLDHRREDHDADRALHLIDADFGAHVGAVPLHEGGVQPVLEQVDQLGALELLGAGQLFNCRDYVGCIGHLGPSVLSRRRPSGAHPARPPVDILAPVLPAAGGRPSLRSVRTRCARAPAPNPRASH